MGRNRKNGSAVRLMPAVWAAVICLLIGSSAIGYVYQKNQIIELGRQIQKSEQKLAGLRDNNAKLRKQLQTHQSGVYLEKRVKELNLGLVQPTHSQILTLVEMPPMTAPRSQPLIAEREVGRVVALK